MEAQYHIVKLRRGGHSQLMNVAYDDLQILQVGQLATEKILAHIEYEAQR